tara:strand:- start:340 stop:639 length:300 start_codon:yes stop_codon:yes gene_type:complete
VAIAAQGCESVHHGIDFREHEGTHDTKQSERNRAICSRVIVGVNRWFPHLQFSTLMNEHLVETVSRHASEWHFFVELQVEWIGVEEVFLDAKMALLPFR